MFEFKWEVPGPPRHEVALQIGARRGWFGRKVLTLDGRTIFRRGRLAGIDTEVPLVEPGARLDLRLVQVDGSPIWRPALFFNGQELPERTGTAPPWLGERPTSLAVVTGLTYLVMLMAIVMLPSIVSILDALYLPHDDRKLVFTVDDPMIDASALRVEAQSLPVARQGEPYSAALEARGGRPPYTWEPVTKDWPRGMLLRSDTGELTFTPEYPYDCSGRFYVTDADDGSVEGAFAIIVRPREPPPANWPAIETRSPPPAVSGASYEFRLEAAGGLEPYAWKVLGGKLPSELKLGSDTGQIAGTPREHAVADLAPELANRLRPGAVPEELRRALRDGGLRLSSKASVSAGEAGADWLVVDGARRLSIRKEKDSLRVYEAAGHFPVAIRVADSAYTASQEIYPWIAPFGVTALCLLGYWNMRRWGVLLYAPLIVLQVVASVVGVLPVATTALVLQAVLWCVGAVHVGKMR